MARGRKPIGEQAMTAAERQRRRRSSEPVRRAKPVKITWTDDSARMGRITVGGEYWGAVEWSEKRQCWCIEDSEGRCLAHVLHIHGKASTKDEAVALALDMVRDGRLPSPEAAKAAQEVHRQARAERRTKRKAQPAQQRKIEEKASRDQEYYALMSTQSDAEWKDRKAPALWEAFHEIFDFTDPELWKSNSFAVLRPRLILHLQAIVAKLEYELAAHRRRAVTQPFAMYASAEQRRERAKQRRTFEEAAATHVETELVGCERCWRRWRRRDSTLPERPHQQHRQRPILNLAPGADPLAFALAVRGSGTRRLPWPSRPKGSVQLPKTKSDGASSSAARSACGQRCA
jgi:polyhydroxyalkanoate synthesis regulator phasin